MINNHSPITNSNSIKFEPFSGKSVEDNSNINISSSFFISPQNPFLKGNELNPFLNLPPLTNILIPQPLEIISNIDWDLEEDDILDEKCNEIFDIIQSTNTSLFKTLNSFNIPHSLSKLIFKQIIKLTIKENNREDY